MNVERQEKKEAYNRAHGIDPTKQKVSSINSHFHLELLLMVITLPAQTKEKEPAKRAIPFRSRSNGYICLSEKVFFPYQLRCA